MLLIGGFILLVVFAELRVSRVLPFPFLKAFSHFLLLFMNHLLNLLLFLQHLLFGNSLATIVAIQDWPIHWTLALWVRFRLTYFLLHLLLKYLYLFCNFLFSDCDHAWLNWLGDYCRLLEQNEVVNCFNHVRVWENLFAARPLFRIDFQEGSRFYSNALGLPDNILQLNSIGVLNFLVIPCRDQLHKHENVIGFKGWLII